MVSKLSAGGETTSDAEYADCMESHAEVTAQLERTELEIASAYELPLQSIREKLTRGELPESDLVRKWQEHYAAFRDWNDES